MDIVQDYDNISNCTFIITNCSFVNNSAKGLGGVIKTFGVSSFEVNLMGIV